MMHPAFAVLANKYLPFGLYDFHMNGIPAKQLAEMYDLPLTWVEERLEAVRLLLKFQVTLGFAPGHAEPVSRPAVSSPVFVGPKVVEIRARA